MRRRTHPHDKQPERRPEWTRRRLLALLVAAGLAVVVLLTGLGLSVYYTVTTTVGPTSADQSDPPHGAPTGTPGDPRQELATRPMPRVPESAAQPGPLTTRRFGVLVLPTADRLGPANVSTGYPRTPEGALAQLIAIDQTALQSASVPAAQEVIEAWAVPGGPTAHTWSGVHALAGLLQAAGLTTAGSPSLTIAASPEMGLIKGTVGPGFVVACVDFVVTATLTQTARVAAADCQSMVWTDDRWMVGPGPEPAQPASVWPGTDAAFDAGYLEIRYE